MSVIELAPVETIDLKKEVTAPGRDSQPVMPLLDDRPVSACEVITSDYAGNTLAEYIKARGRKVMGTLVEGRKLPFVITRRIITEATGPVIHGDRNRLKVFYILSVQPGAGIYYGLKETMAPRDFRAAYEGGTILDHMARMDVKAGEVYVIEAGTVYALEAGITLIEIEEDGKKSCLDDDQLIDTAILEPLEADHTFEPAVEDGQASTTVLATCDSFSCFLTQCHGALQLPYDDESFASLVFVEGTAVINTAGKTLHASQLDSFFVDAGTRDAEVVGNCSYLYTVC